MSQDPKNNQTEEVDLIVFFNYLGAVFNKLFNVIINILKAIFSSIIGVFRTLFKNWIIVGSVIIIAFVLGFVAEKYNSKIYSATMLVEPYFDSKYQLVTNIDYYNALIASNNLKELNNIFETNEEVTKSIVKFKIAPGPETENDRRIQYEDFLKKIDSTRATMYSYDDFIENRSIYSGRLYNIIAYSKKRNIFPSLEKGVTSAFTNEFSRNARKRRDTLLFIQKENLKQQLKQIDSLQNIYIDVLTTESKKQKSDIDLGGISFSTDKQVTKEYDLFLEEQRIRDELKALEAKKIEENELYDIISSFQRVGKLENPWYNRYALIFPILAFIILCLIYFAKNFIQFTLNYEE